MGGFHFLFFLARVLLSSFPCDLLFFLFVVCFCRLEMEEGKGKPF